MADVAVLVGVIDGVGDDLADAVEPALELLTVRHAVGPADENLPVHRLHGLHHLGKTRVVDRHRAPAQELQPFLTDDAHPHALAVGAQPLILRHEQVADGIPTGLGQLDLELHALLGQEVMRNLDEDAGAIARDRIGADRAAVLDVAQDGDRVLDQLVGLAALEIGNKANAAGVVLALGIEEPLGLGDERHSSGLLRGHDNLQHGDAVLGGPRSSSVLHSTLQRTPRAPSRPAKWAGDVRVWLGAERRCSQPAACRMPCLFPSGAGDGSVATACVRPFARLSHPKFAEIARARYPLPSCSLATRITQASATKDSLTDLISTCKGDLQETTRYFWSNAASSVCYGIVARTLGNPPPSPGETPRRAPGGNLCLPGSGPCPTAPGRRPSVLPWPRAGAAARACCRRPDMQSTGANRGRRSRDGKRSCGS